MKKITLLTAICASFALNVKSQVIFSEDFDGIPGPTAGGAGTYVFPTGWFLRNVDNLVPDAQVAYVNDAWERREDFGLNVADSVAFSTSYYTPAGTADDWMWTPLIGPLPANCVLSWNARAYDGAYPDGYEVRIMTAAQGPPTGGTGVMGNQVTNSTVLFSTAAESSSWAAHSINLNAYAGQSVYISWRNHSNDQFLLVIDDVKVEVQLNIDAQMTFADTATPYTRIPVTQTAPLNFNGTIKNGGLNALSNVQAQVNVFNGATNVYSANSSVTASLAPNATTNWTVAPFTPNATGNYTVQFIAQQGSGTDQAPANDTLYQYFIVTDTTYARDDGSVTGSLGIGAGNGGYLGESFDVVNSGILTSVGVYYTRGYTGTKAAVTIWNTVGGVPNAIVASTDTMLYPDDSARFYVMRIHNGGIQLAPGTYAVEAVEFDSTLALGQTNSIFTFNSTWVNWPTNPFGNWASNEAFGSSFQKTYFLRPNFGDVCADNVVTGSATSATCSSCADGSATATASGTDGTLTYSWSNSATTQNISGVTTGTYTVTVTDGFGCMSTTTVTVPYDTCGNFQLSVSETDATCSSCADGTATATVTGSNGSVTYSWSNGATTASVSNLPAGTYYVTAMDSLGCSHTDSVVVNFTMGIVSAGSSGIMSVYPNPNNGQFTLSLHLPQAADMKIEIVNMLGEVVFSRGLSGISDVSLPLSIGKPGIYMVRITTKDEVKLLPVSVQ